MGEYRALMIEYVLSREPLIQSPEYRTFLIEYRALLIEYRALMIGHVLSRESLIQTPEYRTVLIEYTALLIEYRALLTRCVLKDMFYHTSP